MPDVVAAQPALEKARALFATEGLPFPPVPAELAPALREARPNIFATRPVEIPPYTLAAYSLEVQTEPAVASYALVGFDGHGINSWAVHYYLVDDALALFIQLPWGGAYIEPDEARRTIETVFSWAGTLQERTRRAQRDSLIPPGWRLLVVGSHFDDSGWAWVPAPPPGPDAIAWQEGPDIRAAVDKALDDLLAGRAKLD
jgi:hypothetical protein